METIHNAATIVSDIIIMMILLGFVYHIISSTKKNKVGQIISSIFIFILLISTYYLVIYFGRIITVKLLFERISYATVVICGVIVVIFIISVIGRIRSFFNKYSIGPILSFSPAAIISIGIFGTFLGIYLGLIDFDASDINSSIPSLLEGLKTAFITSLFGMFFSLVLKYIYSLFERAELHREPISIDDTVSLLRKIVTEMSSLSMELKTLNSTVLRFFQSEDEFSVRAQAEMIRSDITKLNEEVPELLDEKKTD